MADCKDKKQYEGDRRRDEKPSLDEVWPVHSAGGWPQFVSLDRGDIYEGRT